ncbi:unnamed protein product [Staurois parvus]|uniref:Secreted protein n=1 Tax=Staurois parvus TaxID=386267 RepID=A0ABN9ASG0_9NEOB|nr:unnamed protein product [Staurois parvus]
MFDPVFSDPPLLLLFPIHLLIVQRSSHSAYIKFLLFFSWESASDQHRANPHCPDRRSGVLQPHRTIRDE